MRRVARTVNSELVLPYWQVGKRLRDELGGEARAAYGEEVVAVIGRTLADEFGRGFGKRNLYYTMRFAEAFPDLEIVNAVRAQLSWTHLREIIASDDPLRGFLAQTVKNLH